ncbi:hypothetical protein GEMMAAP_03415 [Gemmatimonas phototrophica]|uniref:AMP-dependent synthetase/ligase domain-containing protein n=1 Tax=Gemmatimonas phototrophica TaxID=1379270 RepID=A0A143BPY3_9BACT|nr:hypothetical protein GEMMAAP_03415 [Gemmatimonas phototrophica]
MAQVVEATAAEHGDRPAIQLGTRIIGYAELTDLASRWAHALCDRAPGARRIGVLGSRSVESYAGALAASWAGACFVPLNPRLHRERLARVIRLAQLDAVIVEPEWEGLLNNLRAELMPALPVLWPSDAMEYHPIPAATAESSDLAYLLFTSGTTGAPKGVGVTNANVLAYLANARARYPFASNDRFSQMFEQSFDVSIFDLFVAWSCGACVVGIPAEQLIAPASYIENEALTVFSAVPSVLSLMRRRRALRPGRFPAVRYSMFIGEALSVENAEVWAAATPNSLVENHYGPTEVTVICFAHVWRSANPTWPGRIVPIGAPFPGNYVTVVNERGLAVTPGDAGELWIAGSQTVPGYWNDEELTERKFVTQRCSDGVDRLFYRTGDLVKELPGGELAFLSRVDDQLKVMGRRIEPGEIEAVLRTIPGVTDAVVVGWPIEDGQPVALTAFVCNEASEHGRALSAADIMTASAARLEAVFVPRYVLFVESFPLNANGKVDRNALFSTLSGSVGRAGSSPIPQSS